MAAGCSAGLPAPPTGPVQKRDMIEVPYPPPPARVEDVPAPKRVGDVWIDGQWDWDGRRWRWQAGAWVSPPPNAYFTPWTTERRDNGRLYFARAAWHHRDGRVLDLFPSMAACPVPEAANP
ncbi:MAG: BcpO-related WXXGXW repeat protein [Polyangiaceae bacterium]|nr:BcpO-related WXXGXW repeat protein [Polyangiaceae bacterium]